MESGQASGQLPTKGEEQQAQLDVTCLSLAKGKKEKTYLKEIKGFYMCRKPFPWTEIKANVPLGSGPGFQTPLSRSLTLQGSQMNALDSNSQTPIQLLFTPLFCVAGKKTGEGETTCIEVMRQNKDKRQVPVTVMDRTNSDLGN
ncbi:hypothetical protein DUI87_10962 [Hirundo rustica rustica]|uniref:Uncharacterized protein n=1 Tax=Hirundo rustica rustica TaxID=333673 RepID=A0A3M0KQ17_HIRRU|nr:hypothetical protein DUI87_10962 [Hirundo rustica rustica]